VAADAGGGRGDQNDDGPAAEAEPEAAPVDRAASASIRELSSSLSSTSSKDAVCMSSYTTFVDGLSRFASETWRRNRAALAARCGRGCDANYCSDNLGGDSGDQASSRPARLPRPLMLAVCGPFGAPEVDVARYDRVALIAGGIGVTALLQYWNHALLSLPAHVSVPPAMNARRDVSMCADCCCGGDADDDDNEDGSHRRVVRRVSLVWCVRVFQMHLTVDICSSC
jgi:hypothetical protein